MKAKNLFFYLKLVSIAFTVFAISSAPRAWCGSGPVNGGAFIPFKIQTLDGKTLDLVDLKGRPAVINFFASWCTECRAEAGWFGKEYLAFRDAGVVFVGIAVQDTKEDAEKFIKEFGIEYPSGLDATGDIAREYRLYGLPKTFIVGKDGRFSFIRTGIVNEDELYREIKTALKDGVSQTQREK